MHELREVSDKELYQLLGKKLKKLREDTNIRQNQMAEKVNLLRTSISNIEAGRQHPPLILLYKICFILGVEVTDVLPKMCEVLKQNVVDVETEDGIKRMPPKAAEMLKKMIND
jgi:DNA-binding XRE family transcriptional regulator